jgi:hypothetical protein
MQFWDDLNYWRNNSYPIAFQNHYAGFVITGERSHINGYGTGGIFGNGNAWYNDEKAVTKPGRPMPFVFWNTTDVFVEHFENLHNCMKWKSSLNALVYVVDPPLWSLNIMNGTNMWFDDIYNNATAVNAPYGTNWVQNTDGFDTSNDIPKMLTHSLDVFGLLVSLVDANNILLQIWYIKAEMTALLSSQGRTIYLFRTYECRDRLF